MIFKQCFAKKKLEHIKVTLFIDVDIPELSLSYESQKGYLLVRYRLFTGLNKSFYNDGRSSIAYRELIRFTHTASLGTYINECV